MELLAPPSRAGPTPGTLDRSSRRVVGLLRVLAPASSWNRRRRQRSPRSGTRHRWQQVVLPRRGDPRVAHVPRDSFSHPAAERNPEWNDGRLFFSYLGKVSKPGDMFMGLVTFNCSDTYGGSRQFAVIKTLHFCSKSYLRFWSRMPSHGLFWS